jgi:ketosteroid isomerase-like protein
MSDATVRNHWQQRIRRSTESDARVSVELLSRRGTTFVGLPDARARSGFVPSSGRHGPLSGGPMSNDHPNVKTVNRMTPAIFDQDHDTLAKIFTDDLVFHLRGSAHPMEGDHSGLGGLLGVIGSFFEATNGDIKLEQQFCIGTDGWAAEWEHATLGRNGKTLESRNAFVYRFEGDRIAEMWMFLGALPEAGEAFLA